MISGMTCVGKSTIYNHLISKYLAEDDVSSRHTPESMRSRSNSPRIRRNSLDDISEINNPRERKRK